MSPTARALRVLLVEDEELNRQLVRAILARARHPILRNASLIEAGTLAQADHALADGPIDIILLEVQLPDGSGLTLAEKLRGIPAGHRPTIIALTAGALPHQNTAALAAGCDTILTKPHTAAELLAVLTDNLPATSTAE